MNLKNIHHVAVIGSDYEQSMHFYTDILGFEVIRENKREDKEDWKIDMQLEGCELELFIKPDAAKRLSHPEACGLRHLAIRVDSVEETVKELQQLGIQTEPIREDDYTGEKLAFFFDPDGLPIELHE